MKHARLMSLIYSSFSAQRFDSHQERDNVFRDHCLSTQRMASDSTAMTGVPTLCDRGHAPCPDFSRAL